MGGGGCNYAIARFIGHAWLAVAVRIAVRIAVGIAVRIAGGVARGRGRGAPIHYALADLP